MICVLPQKREASGLNEVTSIALLAGKRNYHQLIQIIPKIFYQSFSVPNNVLVLEYDSQIMRTSFVISLDFHSFWACGFTMQFQNCMSSPLTISYPQGSKIQRQVKLISVLLSFVSVGKQTGRATGFKGYILGLWPESQKISLTFVVLYNYQYLLDFVCPPRWFNARYTTAYGA